MALEDPALPVGLSENTHKSEGLRQRAEPGSRELLETPRQKMTGEAAPQGRGVHWGSSLGSSWAPSRSLLNELLKLRGYYL